MSDRPRPAPRSIVITGASRGLGAALARLYAGPGIALGLVARDPERLAQTAAQCRDLGAEVQEGVLDVRDGTALAAWIAAFDDRFAVDLLIANAGIAAGPQQDMSGDGLEPAARQIEINLLGTIHAVEAIVPRMIARRRGHVAVLGSLAALRGLPDSPAYCASKAGVRLYGEALRAMLAPAGIAVSVILPGFFESDMSANFHGPHPFMISVERAARIIRHGIARRRSRIVFPRGFGLLLQIADMMPAVLGDWMVRRVRFRIAPLR